MSPESTPSDPAAKKDPSTDAAAKPGPAKAPTSPRVIMGVKNPPPPQAPDARKVIEGGLSALGRLVAPIKSKIATTVAPLATPAAAPAPAPTKEPSAAAAPAPTAAGAAPDANAAAPAASPDGAAPAPAPAPAAPRAIAIPKPANVVTEHVVLRVAAGTGQKANQILQRKGIRDAKVEGDRLEFDQPSNRVSTVLKAMLEAHIELYGLERSAH